MTSVWPGTCDLPVVAMLAATLRKAGFGTSLKRGQLVRAGHLVLSDPRNRLIPRKDSMKFNQI